MTDIRQNFSLIAGDDVDVDYTITPPPPTPIDLTTANLSWKAFPQVRGVADKTLPVIVKINGDGGIEVTDPGNYLFTVHLFSADTTAGTLAGNYYYETVVVDVDNNNRRSTITVGTMTVIDTADPLNVIALKSMFPSLATADDAALQTALDEAALFVDDTWAVQDITAANFYLAGHFITAAQATSGGGQLVTSERIGQIAVTYAAATAATGAYPSLSTTSFGQMFLALMRRNSPGIAVV
jgi:hypothetical protein